MERRRSTREFRLEAVRLIKECGVSYAQAAEDLGVHPTQLRNWVKKLADDPEHAFPGQGQMKPEQLEVAQLKREVAKLKAKRDILKNRPGLLRACAGRNSLVPSSAVGVAQTLLLIIRMEDFAMPTKRIGDHPELKPVNVGVVAIDIGSKMNMAAVNPACTDMPVRAFGTFTQDLHDLADWFKACGGVASVAMECRDCNPSRLSTC
jgi:transposase